MAGPEPDVITEEEYRQWLTPAQAVERVATATGDWNRVYAAILRRADSGKISVRAKDIEWKQGHRNGKFHKYCPIPASIIRQWHDGEYQSFLSFWTGAGDADAETRDNYGPGTPTTEWRLFGIRFDPAGIAEMIPAPAAPQAAVPEGKMAVLGMGPPDAAPLSRGKHPGGAPPKEIWEAVWVDIAARLINGDLDPKKQSDIQSAIEDWGAANNEPIGESTAKRHAKLLWQKVKKGP